MTFHNVIILIKSVANKYKNEYYCNIFLEKSSYKDKARADIKKEFDNEPVHNKEYLKPKMKSHGEEVKDFYDKEISKVDPNHTCLAVISLDFVHKKDVF